MATSGFLFSVGGKDIDAIASFVERGMYATYVSNRWNGALAGTLGDYLTIRPGDNVYFFCNRTVYGVGEIIDVLGEDQAAFEVRRGVTTSRPLETHGRGSNAGGADGKSERWGIAFKPAPNFFRRGIDMDDLLRTDPEAFRAVRAFWKRSFIQLDGRENAAFKAALIRLNSDVLRRGAAAGDVFAYRPCCAPGAAAPGAGAIKLAGLLAEKRDGKHGGRLSSEMLVECGLIDALLKHTPNATDCFGEWDYVAHQVVASPFKPVDYMDRIDVFGYRWVPGFEHEVVEKYLVVEIKKDVSTNRSDAAVRDYEQLMKYVDWICGEYAHGDYSMIEAYLLAADFDIDADSMYDDASLISTAITRKQVIGHDARTVHWSDVTLVRYSVDECGEMSFETYLEFGGDLDEDDRNGI